jgi:hypothetical protein
VVRNEGEGERRDVEQISGRTEHARYERAYAPKARGGYGVFQRLFSYMTDIDRRSALILSTAGAALIASPEPALAQANEAARNKEILAREYKRWHETKGGSVDS